MAQNIEKVIQRGERLDDLVDKTDELNAAVSIMGAMWKVKAKISLQSHKTDRA